jgi:2'-5' RNA ligase
MATEVEDDIDLSAGFRPHGSVHPAGKVTAFDEATGLPIVRRTAVEESHEHHSSGEPSHSTPDHRKGEKENASGERETKTVAVHPERKEGAGSGGGEGVAGQQQGAKPAGESEASAGGKKDDEKEVAEPKYSYGNTQAAIPKDSDAYKAIIALQAKVDDADLAGKGKDVDEPHVTLRYGIQGDDTNGIRKYIEAQAPFEATLGKTGLFPPTKNSDGAAVVMVPIESPDLHRMNAEIEKEGDFKESDFPDYKPHATIAYIKPGAAEKYKGMTDADGKTFRVESVDISNRDGDKENVQLKGSGSGSPSPAKDPKTGRDILHQSTDRAQLVKQAKDHAKQFEDGIKAATRGIAGAKFDAVRPEKSPERVDEKIKEEGQPIHTIPDILAGRIGVDSPEAHERTAAAIKNHFKVVRDENEFEKGSAPTYYRVRKLQAQVTPQLSAEVHIVPKEVLEANAHQHDVYDAAREADLDGKEVTADKKEKQAKAINDAAMAQFNKRNKEENPKSSAKGVAEKPEQGAAVSDKKATAVTLSKGVTVALPDGSGGIVKAGNPNFSQGGRWSILTTDGTRTFKGSELTPIATPKPDPKSPWVGIDLDKTLATAGKFQGIAVIGKPIPAMVDRVKAMIKAGTDVRIFTARISDDSTGIARAQIEAWCQRNLGTVLPVTNKKDELMTKLYDDRAVQVEPNTGKVVG